MGGIQKFSLPLDNLRLGKIAVYGQVSNQLVAACGYNSHEVITYNLRTQTLKTKPLISGDQSGQPYALAYSADGSLYVGDVKLNKIHVFSPDFEYKSSFGGEGNGEGQFKWPLSLAFTSQGFLLVADFENHRVQVLREDGAFVRFLGVNHRIDAPNDVCVAPSGHILVASPFKGLFVFDSQFQYVGLLKVPDLRFRTVAVSFDGTVVAAHRNGVKMFRRLLDANFVSFTVTDGTLKPVTEPCGTEVDGFEVSYDHNVRVDKEGNIFMAEGCDIIKIPYD